MLRYLRNACFVGILMCVNPLCGAAAPVEQDGFVGDFLSDWYTLRFFSQAESVEFGQQVTSISNEQVVLVNRGHDRWHFAYVEEKREDGSVVVMDFLDEIHQVIANTADVSVIKELRPLFQLFFQPTVRSRLFNESVRGFTDLLNADWPHPVAYTKAMIVRPSTKIFVVGDIHGDFFSLEYILNRFYQKGILDNNARLVGDNYLVFTGDIADRGEYGVECWYMIARLAIANPHRVFVLRGNHEYDPVASEHGYHREFNEKIGQEFWESHMLPLWEKLPHVLLLGNKNPQSEHCDFVMLCHAGMDDDWRVRQLMQAAVLMPGSVLSQQLVSPDIEQFNWADFDPALNEGHAVSSRGAGVRVYSQDAAESFMRGASHAAVFRLSAIIRAHQHTVGLGVHQLSHVDRRWVPLIPGYGYTDVSGGYHVYTVISCTGVPAGADVVSYAVLRAKSSGQWSLRSVISNF